jgi:hypothetical protein
MEVNNHREDRADPGVGMEEETESFSICLDPRNCFRSVVLHLMLSECKNTSAMMYEGRSGGTAVQFSRL